MTQADTSSSIRQITLERRLPTYWRVTLDNPPVNIFGPEQIPQLNEIISAIEVDEPLKVVVFDSATRASSQLTTIFWHGSKSRQSFRWSRRAYRHCPTCWCVSVARRSYPLPRSEGVQQTLEANWHSPAICASRAWKRRSCLHGGGCRAGSGRRPHPRLPRLMGRGRALEVLLGADDVNGEVAERYGYVNRSFPDHELDGFVEALAMRIASFDKEVIANTKRLVDLASLPPDSRSGRNGMLLSRRLDVRRARSVSRDSWIAAFIGLAT